MEVIEKLRVMLPHWIEHNRGHGEEFSRWAEEIAGTDAELAEQLRRAVHSLEHAQEALEQALRQVGGPAAEDAAGHHGHHHHHH
jgi:ERCC4-type nuclease